MSQPILKLNATKNTRGTIVNAGAHKSNFGAAFPDAGLLSYVLQVSQNNLFLLRLFGFAA